MTNFNLPQGNNNLPNNNNNNNNNNNLHDNIRCTLYKQRPCSVIVQHKSISKKLDNRTTLYMTKPHEDTLVLRRTSSNSKSEHFNGRARKSDSKMQIINNAKPIVKLAHLTQCDPSIKSHQDTSSERECDDDVIENGSTKLSKTPPEIHHVPTPYQEIHHHPKGIGLSQDAHSNDTLQSFYTNLQRPKEHPILSTLQEKSADINVLNDILNSALSSPAPYNHDDAPPKIQYMRNPDSTYLRSML